MPLVNIALQQQEQAASSGIQSFPAFKQPTIQSTIFDQFNRETLNPTDFPAYYTSSVGAGASIVTSAGDNLLFATGATITTIATTRISELNFNRTRRFGAEIVNQFEFDYIFRTVETTDVETFIGLVDAETNLTALPTTARSLGIFYDLSAGANYILTSGDGTDQTTTDTGVAVNDGGQRLNIIWNGDNSATIRFFSGTNFDTEESSQTVTALNIAGRTLLSHVFLRNEAAANKRFQWFQWTVKAT